MSARSEEVDFLDITWSGVLLFRFKPKIASVDGCASSKDLTERTVTRFALSVAVAEARFAARQAPRIARHAALIVAWSAVAILCGVIVGYAAVILPPTGTFGIVAVCGVVLLWVTPDFPIAPLGAVRKAFFVLLVANSCIPSYYTVQIAGLPWISARRVITFVLVALFLFALAASSSARRRIAHRVASSKSLIICAAGFLTMIFLSVFSSVSPTETMSAFTDAILSWYVPFFAMIYIIDDYDDIVSLWRSSTSAPCL